MKTNVTLESLKDLTFGEYKKALKKDKKFLKKAKGVIFLNDYQFKDKKGLAVVLYKKPKDVKQAYKDVKKEGHPVPKMAAGACEYVDGENGKELKVDVKFGGLAEDKIQLKGKAIFKPVLGLLAKFIAPNPEDSDGQFNEDETDVKQELKEGLVSLKQQIAELKPATTQLKAQPNDSASLEQVQLGLQAINAWLSLFNQGGSEIKKGFTKFAQQLLKQQNSLNKLLINYESPESDDGPWERLTEEYNLLTDDLTNIYISISNYFESKTTEILAYGNSYNNAYNNILTAIKDSNTKIKAEEKRVNDVIKIVCSPLLSWAASTIKVSKVILEQSSKCQKLLTNGIDVIASIGKKATNKIFKNSKMHDKIGSLPLNFQNSLRVELSNHLGPIRESISELQAGTISMRTHILNIRNGRYQGNISTEKKRLEEFKKLVYKTRDYCFQITEDTVKEIPTGNSLELYFEKCLWLKIIPEIKYTVQKKAFKEPKEAPEYYDATEYHPIRKPIIERWEKLNIAPDVEFTYLFNFSWEDELERVIQWAKNQTITAWEG